MAADDLDTNTPDYAEIADLVLTEVAKYISADVVVDTLAKAILKALAGLAKGLGATVAPMAKYGGEALVAAEEPILPAFAAFVTPIVTSMFGSEADASMFDSRANHQGRSAASAALVDSFMQVLAGDDSGEAAPSDDGAKRIAGAAVHASLEGWFNAWILEMLGDCIPWEWLKFKEMTKLPEDIERSLGLGRLVRRAIAPLVDATAATPMKWKVNKERRPNLLSEGDIIKAFQRDDYTGAEAAEELARLGYSNRRQDMLLKSAQKYLSLDDGLLLTREADYTLPEVLAALKAQGDDDATARWRVIAADTKRLLGIRDDLLSTLKHAYANREIDDSQFQTLLYPIINDDQARSEHTHVADIMRSTTVSHMSQAQVVDCVKKAIVPLAFYRAWMRRNNYPDDEMLALELLLETEIHKDLDIEKARKEKEKQLADEKAQRAADAAKRAAEMETAHALARRGSLAELRRAAVRGLVPFARVEEVLRASFDDDYVRSYMALVEADRQDYLAQLQKADDAKKKAALRHIDVGQLEAAVLEGVLTVEEYAQQLARAEFDPADAAILVATLRQRLADQTAAKQKRAAAEEAAKKKSVDLSRVEQLVRRGARSLAEYDALLRSLGFDDGSRAAIVDLLKLHIADDVAARDARAAADAKLQARGLSLEQYRRAVILELRTIDQFSEWLYAQHFTSDAVAVLVAELRDDVAAADAARRKRETPPPTRGPVALPVSTVARAARLGIIPPDVYRARLVTIGYSDDDIALEMNLLMTEIADVQAARAKQAAADAAAKPPGLTLAQSAAAVKAGVEHLEDYRARAAELGLPKDDVDTLVRVLGDELAATQAAKIRRDAIQSTLKPGDVSLAQLADQVAAGTLAIDNYRAALEQLGLDPIDADLLTQLLRDESAGGG